MPKVVVLYHFLYPDDVVSARLFDGLCTGLASHGWEVLAFPCNRSSHSENGQYSNHEVWQGVTFRRIWRPLLRQSSTLGRVTNAVWMIGAWGLKAAKTKSEAVIIGTDPICSILVARLWRFLQPEAVIAHWCYDLYPEAAVADGLIKENSFLTKTLRRILKPAYRSCTLLADIGSCMRERISGYDHSAKEVTLVPWALYEPASLPQADERVRRSLFGKAKLGLLYSGNFGRAHSYKEILALARRLRQAGIHFVFGVRGNSLKELAEAIRSEDINVKLAPFAPESELKQRLCAADIHLVSLKAEWTGTVVPSKFFGSLAVGRPVLFAGSRKSAIAGWIEKYQVGWVLDDVGSLEHIAGEMEELSQSPGKLKHLQQHCHKVYQKYFTRGATIEKWNTCLQELTTEARPN